MKLQNKDFVVNYPDEGFHVFVNPSGKWLIGEGSYHVGYDSIATGLEQTALVSENTKNPRSEVALVVFVTEQCNMRCSYCKYERMITSDYKRATNAPKIGASIAEFASNNEIVNVTFFGGEPLMKYREIDSICRELEAHHNNINYGITTNGTILSDEILRILKRHKITVGVSFDGAKTQHDTFRRYASTKKTYTTVFENYYRLKNSKVNCGPIAVINEVDRYIDTFAFFYKEFNDLNIYLKRLDVTGEEVIEDVCEYYEKFLEMQLRLLDRLIDKYEKEGIRLIETDTKRMLDAIFLSQIRPNNACNKAPHCGLGEELQSINADGSRVPCPDLNQYIDYDSKFLDKLKSRKGYCEGCILIPVCNSFCMSQFNEGFIQVIEGTQNSEHMEVLCWYNQTFIGEIFKRIRRNKERLLGYYLGV